MSNETDVKEFLSSRRAKITPEQAGLPTYGGNRWVDVWFDVYTPPGEWHWHGASAGHFMSHLAMWESTEDGTPETTWGEHLTDEEYPA